MTTTPDDDAGTRRLEAARWRVSAEFAVPLALVVGDAEPEMRQAAADALIKAGHSRA